MPHIGFPELILILVIALIIFGPGKLPSVGSAIGKSFKEFRKASRELTKEDSPDQSLEAASHPASDAQEKSPQNKLPKA